LAPPKYPGIVKVVISVNTVYSMVSQRRIPLAKIKQVIRITLNTYLLQYAFKAIINTYYPTELAINLSVKPIISVSIALTAINPRTKLTISVIRK